MSSLGFHSRAGPAEAEADRDVPSPDDLQPCLQRSGETGGIAQSSSGLFRSIYSDDDAIGHVISSRAVAAVVPLRQPSRSPFDYCRVEGPASLATAVLAGKLAGATTRL